MTARSRAVVFVVHAGRVGEMCIRRAAEHLRRLVHQVGKALDAPGEIFRDGVGGLVARTDQHDRNQVEHRHLFPGDERDGLVGRRNEINGILRHRDHVVFQIGHLQGDVGGHNLRRGRGEHDLVRVLFKEHLAGVRLDQNGAVRIEHIFVENIRMVLIPCDGVRRERRGDEALRLDGLILGQRGRNGGYQKRCAQQQRKQALGQNIPSVYLKQYTFMIPLFSENVQRSRRTNIRPRSLPA